MNIYENTLNCEMILLKLNYRYLNSLFFKNIVTLNQIDPIQCVLKKVEKNLF